MGYYTNFTIYPRDYSNLNLLLKELTKIHPYSKSFECEDGEIYVGEHRWYNWEEDCKAISQKYPKIIFMVRGVGDEWVSGDMWQALFHGGRIVNKWKFKWPSIKEMQEAKGDA